MAEREIIYTTPRAFGSPPIPQEDYFTLRDIQEVFGLTRAQSVSLCVRWVWSAWHDPELRERIQALVKEILTEDTSLEKLRYKREGLAEIQARGIRRP